MTEPTKTDKEAGPIAEQPERLPYRRPLMVKLGSLRDVTMTISPGNKKDGMNSRNTSRGGDFKALD